MLHLRNDSRTSGQGFVDFRSELGRAAVTSGQKWIKNRENSITILPDELKDLKDLKVLDLAENNLLYLPYGLKEVELQAIWLSENQSKSLIQFRV